MNQVIIQETVRIKGGRGILTGELTYPEDEATCVCLLVNPHPHMGGAMGNNVIAALASKLPESGIATLKFDYAGVGESEGEGIDIAHSMARFWKTSQAPEDESMKNDASCMLNWLTDALDLPVIMIGYSFGAYVASNLLCPNVNAVVLINPTLKQHTFSVAGWSQPTLVIFSDNDFATPVEKTRQWVNQLPTSTKQVCIPHGEHFYRGMESRVCQEVVSFIAGVPFKVSGEFK